MDSNRMLKYLCHFDESWWSKTVQFRGRAQFQKSSNSFRFPVV
jgi:hypothetical protein